MRRPFAKALLVPAAIAATLVTAPPPAAADSPDDYSLQSFGFGSSMFRNYFLGPPPITRQQVRTYADVLDLSPEQLELALELQRQLSVEHRNAWTSLRETMSDAQYLQMRSEDPEKMQEEMQRQQSLSEEFEDATDRLAIQFFDDLRLILSESQEGNWDRFERARRRATTLTQYATFDDERYDLIAMVNSLDLPAADREAVTPLLNEYEVELDAALRVRNERARTLAEAMEAHDQNQMSAWTGGNTDWQTQQAKQEELERNAIAAALETRDAATRVRDTNRRHTDRLLSELSPDATERLRAALGTARRAGPSSPMDFGNTSRATMAFAFVEHLPALDDMMNAQGSIFTGTARERPATPPLTDQHRDAIDELRADFDQRLARLQAEYADTAALNDDAQANTVGYPGGTATLVPNRDDGVPGQAFFNPMAGQQDPESQEFNRERADLDQWAIDNLRDILTIEQRAAFAHF